MEATEVVSELVVAESTALEPSGENARAALRTYLDVQKVFDAEMPDAIMTIEGKKFRKKSYWRGVGTTFHVQCKIVEVKRVEFDDDWGYEAIVCATTNDGRSSDGDGACMASEKTKRDGSPSKMQSVHNVRSHAVTRAKNRAISDLVGFGEVSADELGPDAFGGEAAHNLDARPRPAPAQPVTRPGATKLASEKQTKMLYAKSLAHAEKLGITGTDYEDEKALAGSIRKAAMTSLGFIAKENITAAAVTPMVAAIEAAVLDDEGRVMIPDGDL